MIKLLLILSLFSTVSAFGAGCWNAAGNQCVPANGNACNNPSNPNLGGDCPASGGQGGGQGGGGSIPAGMNDAQVLQWCKTHPPEQCPLTNWTGGN